MECWFYVVPVGGLAQLFGLIDYFCPVRKFQKCQFIGFCVSLHASPRAANPRE